MVFRGNGRMGEWENGRTRERKNREFREREEQGNGRTGKRKNGGTREGGTGERGTGEPGNGETEKRRNGETEKRRNGETEERGNGRTGERGGHQLPLTEYQGELKKVYCYWVLSGNQVKFWCDNLNPPTSPYPPPAMNNEVARANGTRHDVGSSKELEIMINEILAFVNYL